MLGLIGVSMNPEDGTLHMIMPFMHHGDVKAFLKSKRGDMVEFDQFPEVRILDLFIGIIIYRMINLNGTYVKNDH